MGLWKRAIASAPYLLLATGAILLVVGIWASVDARSRAEESNATARALDRANSAARSFEQYAFRTLKAADNLTRMAVVSLAHNVPEETIRRAKLTNIVDGEIFQSLNIQDSLGNLIGSTIDNTRPLNYSDREYFKRVVAAQPDELIIGIPVVSRLTGEPAVPVARRYDTPDGKFGGVVLVQVRADAFERGYRDLDLQGMDYVALIGLDGIARAGSIGGSPAHGRDFSTSNVFLQHKEAPTGSFSATANTDGLLRHVAYRTLEECPLFVAFGVDAEVARADFLKRQAEFVTIGALATALVFFFTGGLWYAFMRRDQVNAQLRVREDALRALATHDFLTRLPNRVTLETVAAEKLKSACTTGAEVACIFIDLDNFSEINSALGHPMGDQVLKAVAGALASRVEQIGHVARIGGDEFVVLFQTEGEGEACALELAGLLRTTIDTLQVAEGAHITLRASMGISLFPRHACTFADLLRRADDAMAHSKVGRRGAPVVFSPSMDRLAETRLAIRGGLAEAIQKGELEVFYQPKLDLQTLRPVGIEALLRWRHPVRGLVSPGDFIPVAEDSGLIVPIGAWVLARACRDCATLLGDGYGLLSVAVNVSALQFRQPDLVATVAKALGEAGLPAPLLELELTESMIADDPEATATLLERLKEIGVSLAIDDFGTGYSNLQYLRRFPVDVLKVDRSFVSEIPHNSHSSSIVLAILALAKALGLSVVAEGVETPLQEAFLKANGCAFGQGFMYGKPMTFTELRTWLSEQRVVGQVGRKQPGEARAQAG